MKQSIKRVLALALAAVLLVVSLALPVFMGLGARAAEAPTETGSSPNVEQTGTKIIGDAPEAVLQALGEGLSRLQQQELLPAPKNELQIAERTALYAFDLETFKKNNDLDESQHFVQWVFTIHDGDSFYTRAGITEDLGQAKFAGIEYDNESIDQTAKKIRDLNQTPTSLYTYNNQLYLLGSDADGARMYYTVAKDGAGPVVQENDMKNLLLRDHNLLPVSSAGSESTGDADEPQQMNPLTLYLLIMGGIVLVIAAVIVIANLSKRGRDSAPPQDDTPPPPADEPETPADSDATHSGPSE